MTNQFKLYRQQESKLTNEEKRIVKQYFKDFDGFREALHSVNRAVRAIEALNESENGTLDPKTLSSIIAAYSPLACLSLSYGRASDLIRTMGFDENFNPAIYLVEKDLGRQYRGEKEPDWFMFEKYQAWTS